MFVYSGRMHNTGFYADRSVRATLSPSLTGELLQRDSSSAPGRLGYRPVPRESGTKVIPRNNSSVPPVKGYS